MIRLGEVVGSARSRASAQRRQGRVGALGPVDPVDAARTRPRLDGGDLASHPDTPANLAQREGDRGSRSWTPGTVATATAVLGPGVPAPEVIWAFSMIRLPANELSTARSIEVFRPETGQDCRERDQRQPDRQRRRGDERCARAGGSALSAGQPADDPAPGTQRAERVPEGGHDAVALLRGARRPAQAEEQPHPADRKRPRTARSGRRAAPTAISTAITTR